MKQLRNILLMLPVALAALATLSACSHTKSYAELLNDETKYINAYLADQRIIGDVPADSIFIQGENAPYYRMDEDGNVYMRVIKDDPSRPKAKYNDLVYMRFTRYNLYSYADGKLPDGEGNDDSPLSQFNFRYQNMESTSSTQWGEGLQRPLDYLHYDCEVELVIRSQVGMNSEIAAVTPYMYRVRYYKSNI
ncbi:DUF4827 family protein [uncultured Muribaculum sp.]|uniref:DUF4827 family protein n=1 Tax=uncultured Muribaculum sp. TaxID=1918613 RepID=UPI0025ED4490|nr:DUF4827 family protein [uncultured Muribaculum sp.]